MADLYLTPAERYTAALGGFYYGDLPEPGTVYTQLIKDILDGSTPDKEPKNILVRFIYSLYISDLGDQYPRYELAKLLYWKLHNITPTKSGSILTVTIDGKEDYMTINTDLSRLWYKVLFGSKTDVITEFPYIFNTMQNKLSDWELFGNTVQNGTPTPDNPIMPQGTGEMTGNLCDIGGFTSGETETKLLQTITLNAGTYTYSCIQQTALTSNSRNCLMIRIGSATYTYESTQTNYHLSTGRHSMTFTVPADNTSVELRYWVNSFSNTCNFDSFMLNTGSTPLPYEPYGYKIPISSASTITPVYLGEVETTRKIKKLVLTGEEDFVLEGIDTNRTICRMPLIGCKGNYGFCSHINWKSSYKSSEYNRLVWQTASGGILYISLANEYLEAQTLYAFKSYLAQQYAAGTPVCVWYVLAEPTTGIVNEPLMKIGAYADSMSRTQTGIDIPTVIGQNTLDVLTTVKPSSMSIEYTSADETRSRSKRISLLKSPLKKGLIK